MHFTIKEVAELTGVSVRTLRYYDEIGLLAPAFYTQAGYRIYKEEQIDLLQQILFYRSLDMKLAQIKTIVTQSDFNIQQALITHHQELLEKKAWIESLIATVEKTLAYQKGENDMTNQEKFEAFKKNKVLENEKKYGKEMRQKYGEKTIDGANEKWSHLSENDFQQMNAIEQNMLTNLKKVFVSKDIDSPVAKEVYEQHKQWLNYSWSHYTSTAHIGLAQMYVADERFAEYYNQALGTQGLESVCLLRDIIEKYAK